GELLQVASCINNKLIGAEYRKNIQRGTDYEDRGEMLEKAISAPQGSGYGIGLSLGDPLEPVEKSWVHNRWPRFTYSHGALNIRLQYYIDASTVIQEYQVQNTGQEEVRLPYIYSSDICFREHWSDKYEIYPVPTGKSPARLLLFQNSQVVVTNHENRWQMSMALFLNAQRRTLWALEDTEPLEDTESLDRSLHYTEDTSDFDHPDEILRDDILQGNLVDENTDFYLKKLYQRGHDRRPGIRHSSDAINLASHSTSLVVPPGSTQELRAVIQLSALLESKQSEPHSAPAPETNDHKEDRQRTGNNQAETDKERLRSQQRALVYNSKQLSLKDSSQGARRQISQFIADHLEVGKACSMLNDFLYNHDWVATALEIIEPLPDTLSKNKPKAKELAMSLQKVQNRLATMYLKTNRFSEAEDMYGHVLPHSIGVETVPEPLSAHYLERQAWAQVQQQNFAAAHKVYYKLLLKLPNNRRGTVLSNLGFIEWRLYNFETAKSFFEQTLSLGDTSISSSEQLYARSALYACLNKLGTRPEDDPRVACTLMRYGDFGSPLFHSSSARIPMDNDGPLRFAMARHLETLLSSCCVQVENNEGIIGTAFLDADPSDSVHRGDNSYFQYKFLIQYQMYINTRQAENAAYRETSERIKHACRSHLVWIFQIAELPPDETWANIYPVGGSWVRSKIPADERTESRALQGAFQFSKLWLYVNTWSKDWKFTVEQLHCKLEGWLSYLRATQHMGNLWVEQSSDENLRPYDTISADHNMLDQRNPKYYLSDFTMLWLAFKQLERLIDLIEKGYRWDGLPEDDPLKLKVNNVREVFDSHRNTLSIERIRLNILRTFTVSERDDLAFHTNIYQKTVNSTKENTSVKAQSPIQVGSPELSTYAEDSAAERMRASQDSHSGKPARQVIAFARPHRPAFSTDPKITHPPGKKL
ncbi:MAG: hypothetical protein Q9180_005668, partial [Flavoplaca navasiana]